MQSNLIDFVFVDLLFDIFVLISFLFFLHSNAHFRSRVQVASKIQSNRPVCAVFQFTHAYKFASLYATINTDTKLFQFTHAYKLYLRDIGVSLICNTFNSLTRTSCISKNPQKIHLIFVRIAHPTDPVRWVLQK